MTTRNAFRRLGHVALGVLVGVAAVPVAAQQVTRLQAEGSYQLGTGSVQSQLDQLPNSPVDVLALPPVTDGNSAIFHSYGAPDGYFGTRSSGGGSYDVSSGFHITEKVTNTAAYKQNASFSFTISPGLLMNNIGSPLVLDDYVESGLNFSIKLNGVSIWENVATLKTTFLGSEFDASGPVNLYTGSGTYYYIIGRTITLDLGTLAAGASFDLSYDLTSYAKGSSTIGDSTTYPATDYFVPGQFHPEPAPVSRGDFGTLAVGEQDVFIDEHTVHVPPSTGPGVSYSFASSGDPFDITLSGQPDFDGKTKVYGGAEFNFTRAVPEPGTWALMLAGFGLTGLSLRRRGGRRVVSA